MVAATMDLIIASSEDAQGIPSHERLYRARTALQGAIDVNRRIVEELRPSILDHFGLFAALRWQLKKSCGGSLVICSETYPEIEPAVEPKPSLAIFRVAQEALAMAFARPSLRFAALHVHTLDEILYVKLTEDGIPECSIDEEATARIAIASMRYRLRQFGGKILLARHVKGGSELTASLPLQH